MPRALFGGVVTMPGIQHITRADGKRLVFERLQDMAIFELRRWLFKEVLLLMKLH